jgi:endo-1,4-beta-xylanase
MLVAFGIATTLFTCTQGNNGLRPLAQRINLNLGAAVQSGLVQQNADQGKYISAIRKNFTMIEPENDLKPPSLWLGVGQYNFSGSDSLINWALDNQLKVRGHVLVYADDGGYTIPGWLLSMENSISREQAKTMLHDYIFTVVGRYSGKIFAWDVINEAISDSPNSNPFNLRNSFWFRKLGKDFLVYAFQFAHQADPRCKLYYNDYNIESGGAKADHVFEIVSYLRSKRAQIDGIGLQFHWGSGDKPNPGDNTYGMLNRIRNRALKFMITELDLSVPVVNYSQSNPNFGLIPINSNDLLVQADTYKAFVKMVRSFDNCEGIQMWGVNDSHSWIPYFTGGNRGAALLLDGQFNLKPAYESFANALN